MTDILPFPPWEPDKSTYKSASSQTIKNVFPRADGYGPVPDFSALTAALPGACRGFFYGRTVNSSVTEVVVFGATSDRLFRLDNTTLTWVPVSKVTALTSISNASPAVFTLVAHGRSIGDAIVLSTTGSLPTGLTVGTVYYIIAGGFTANAFEVALTPGGTAINTSSAGSGTHSFTDDYTALPLGYHWQFAQFGSIVIAVQPNTNPQAFTMGSSSAFADLAGSPPQAAYIAIVGRFVVLSGLTSTPFTIAWSAIGSAIGWTPGVNSSDTQALPDGGIVRGVAGGEYGVIFQETTMRRMIFAPGSPTIFNIEKIADDKGLLAPYSIIRAGDKIFWLAAQGFHGMLPTGAPEAIGKEKFDRFFFENYDSGNLQLVIGASDPEATRVYWTFKSASASGTTFNFILCYDYGIGKPSLIETSGEYLASLAAPGLTLDALDTINTSIDALTFSLDDVSTAALSKLSAANTSHQIGFYSGSNLEATLDTAEQANGRRLRVKGFRPITDAITCYGSIGGRETVQENITYSAEQAVNGRGRCPANVSTRMARGRLRIPAATNWTFATGVEPDAVPEGKR